MPVPESGATHSARFVQSIVACITPRPWFTVALFLVLIASSVWLAIDKLQYKTQRNDLMNAGSPGQQRWQRYLDAFGPDEDFVFVLRGAKLERMTAAADRIAAELQNRPGHFDRVFHKIDQHYFFTTDRKLLTVLARPKIDGDSFTPALRACNAARSLLSSLRREYPDLDFGLTGLPVLETDEMAASDRDANRANWLALGGVIALYLVVYRGLRYPLLTMTTLLAGTILTLGWATLTVGHLNILSAAFAVMLIGMGDYGVLWVAHYDERRRRGASVHDALKHTAEHAGPGIVTASVMTSLAFAATLIADFPAVAELGWIAGWGILSCALACFTLLPALIVISERWRASRRTSRHTLPFYRENRSFLPRVAGRPRAVFAATGALLIICLIGATQLNYDANLLHMQAKGLDSVYWEEQLIRHSSGTTWDALSLAATRDDALKLKAKYEELPGVGRVVEAASLESVYGANLPPAFRERYIAPNGAYLVRAFAADSLWDFAALERFTTAAQSVDPNATGKSFRTLEGLRQMKSGFLNAGLAAFAVIAVLFWLDFRAMKWMLLGLLPLALGLTVTVGILGWAGVTLNPANLIALPLILGVGADNGVHVLHDFLEQPRDRRYRLAAATGRGIAVASLTTILGFGTLMIAHHRGLASLGLALTLGVTACMLASLIVLPAILQQFAVARKLEPIIKRKAA